MAVTSLFPILLTHDLPRLVAFYTEVLDGTVDYRYADGGEDVYVSLALGAAALGIGRDPNLPEEPTDDRITLWFYVDDVDSAFRRATEAGALVVAEPTDRPWGERVAQVRDVDGNLVNLGAQAAVGQAPEQG